jgi:hypothetical protein
MPPQTSFRLLHHADGRVWSVRVRGQAAGARLELRFVVDGEAGERTIKHKTLAEAEAAAARLTREQEADGFVGAAADDELLARLVANWQDDDPDFDIVSLEAQIQALPAGQRSELWAALRELEDHRRRDDDDDSWVLEYTPERHQAARAVFERHLPAALPMLLLGLRHEDHGAQIRIDAILGAARLPASLPAVLSAIAHPAENLASHLGGRPRSQPVFALQQLGRPADEVLAQLVAMLDAPSFEPVATAATILGDHLAEPAVFAELWSRRFKSHHLVKALLRAVPLRPGDAELRRFLRDFVGDPLHRWPDLSYEREQMARWIAELETKGTW